jgi:hypothetical protein
LAPASPVTLCNLMSGDLYCEGEALANNLDAYGQFNYLPKNV